MKTRNVPAAKAEMLIRKPVAQVFEAFIDPAITSKFWFSRGSGRLEAGKQVIWEWEMYGLSIQTNVKAIELNRRILIEWPGDGTSIGVEWQFTPRPDDSTFVSIASTGFTGNDDEIVAELVSTTEGFALVLAGLKAHLEHDVSLNLVADRFPDGLPVDA